MSGYLRFNQDGETKVVKFPFEDCTLYSNGAWGFTVEVPDESFKGKLTAGPFLFGLLKEALGISSPSQKQGSRGPMTVAAYPGGQTLAITKIHEGPGPEGYKDPVFSVSTASGVAVGGNAPPSTPNTNVAPPVASTSPTKTDIELASEVVENVRCAAVAVGHIVEEFPFLQGKEVELVGIVNAGFRTKGVNLDFFEYSGSFQANIDDLPI